MITDVPEIVFVCSDNGSLLERDALALVKFVFDKFDIRPFPTVQKMQF